MNHTVAGLYWTYALSILAVAFGCLSCEIDHSVGPEHIGIDISQGTTPSISWGGGPINFLAIVPAEYLEGYYDSEPYAAWAIQTPGQDAIYAPVMYGQLPHNAVDVTDSLYRQSELTLEVEYVAKASRYRAYDLGTTRFNQRYPGGREERALCGISKVKG